MSEGSLQISDLLSGIMEHPEMLQKAMNIASSLASSGILNDLMKMPPREEPSDSVLHSDRPSKDDSAPSFSDLLSRLNENEHRPSEDSRPPTQHTHEHEEKPVPPTTSSSHPSAPRVGHTERIRLLQSLRPFLPSDQQEKIDFIIKLLGLLEAAERMGLGKLF